MSIKTNKISDDVFEENISAVLFLISDNSELFQSMTMVIKSIINQTQLKTIEHIENLNKDIDITIDGISQIRNELG